MSDPAIAALARLFHHSFLGLQLMVSVREGAGAVGDWIFRLFRSQHEQKFLSSFAKLGLEGLPHAVACARYHVLSNGIGGVAVDYMEESDRKAWVRFRYPRWMYDGPALCGIPVEASRGFLEGWYAQNGVSLRNPRLGFVCVSEDMGAGAYGLCGYFREADRDLAPEERLVFAPDETPPPYDPARQPKPPVAEWNAERLARAERNYALDYVRNGLVALKRTIGRDKALAIGREAARLTGLQARAALAEAVGARDGGPEDAADLLARLFAGMGDAAERGHEGDTELVDEKSLRIVRGIDGEDREDLVRCWIELWRGVVASHRRFLDCRADPAGEGLLWRIRERD